MFKKAISYYKPYKKLFIIDLLCAVLVAGLEMVFPSMMNYIVDDLLPSGRWNYVILTSLFLGLIYLLCTVLYMVIEYWGEKLGMYIENDLRIQLFEHLQKLSFKYFDNNKVGQLIARVSNDLPQISTVAHYAPEQFIVATSMIICTVIIMSSVNVYLALLILVVVAIILALNIYFTKKMVSTMRSLFASAGEISTSMEENLAGIRVIQSYTNEELQKERFFQETLKYCKNQVSGIKKVALCNGITYLLTRILPVLTVLTAGALVLEGSMSKGEFFSFILLTNLMLKPVEMLSNFAARYPKGIAGFKNFLELMAIEPEILDKSTAKEISNVQGNINYKNVTFSYSKEKEILKGINLTIDAGTTVAIVGNSGAGKSTLCSLLPRFYEIEKGDIELDGINVKDIKLNALRKQIGVVQQEVFLFSGTIEENIRFGKLDATNEEIWSAARNAQLEEFINNQPEGLKTIIGERGVKLSGGQKQRLSIARMFLKNPSILILDEATSALDTKNELQVHLALNRLAKGRTTIIIAHRFSTIQKADKIVVVDEGKIAEMGTHKELMSEQGIYSKLYNLQFNYAG